MKWNEIKEIAARLRNDSTPSEKKLWLELRQKKLEGRKFLRQHPVFYDSNSSTHDYFFFIPDFYCASEQLVIELDGKIHDFQKDRDYRRDEILKALNLKVLRIKNEELEFIDLVLEKIKNEFEK
jgi:very-short-patch-repair endonuclease